MGLNIHSGSVPRGELQDQPVAPSPTPTHSLGLSLAAPQTCLPITPCRTSCASHDVGERIVRRQGIGAARLARERVSVRLAITCTICDQRGLTRIVQPICEASAILICRCNERARMGMVRHLSHTQSRFPDSAGNTRPPPSTPRLPPLRRGLHSAPHSTAKYGWPLLTTRQTEDGCVIHHCRQKTYRCGSVSCCYRY